MRLEAALNEYIVLPMHISERAGLEKRSYYIASVQRIGETFSISANGHTRRGQTKLSRIRALQWCWFDRNSSIIANEATPKIRFDGSRSSIV